MVSMCSQHQMPAFSSNFQGDKIFGKLKVSANLWANHPKFHENSVFYLNDRTLRNEVESLQEKDCMAAHKKRSDTWLLTVEPDRGFFAPLCNSYHVLNY